MNDTLKMNNYIDICFISIYKGELSLLLVKRGKEPYKGTWALPGGVWQPNLDPDDAANFQMFRKTGLRDIYLEQLRTFGGLGRDPRGPTATVAYLGLVNYDKLNKEIENSDNEEMKWFPIDKVPQLAFDHNKIVQEAQARIVNKIRYTKVGFELVGEEFTLKELVTTFEKIIGDKIDQSNLRRKLVTNLEVLKEVKRPKYHKPTGKGRQGVVYELDEINFRKMPIYETLF